jgi:hypothetical protein
LTLEGPAQTMRGVPARWLRHLHGSRRTWRQHVGLVVVLAGAAAGYGGDRRRPVTGGVVRGSRRVRRARVRRTRRKLPLRNGETPEGEPRPLTAVTLAALPLGCSRPASLFTGRGRQARRAEGAPLKLRGESCNNLTEGTG